MPSSEEHKFNNREYQNSAWKDMRDYLSRYLHNTLGAKSEGQIQNSMLIHMATGSGKTFTVGSFVNDIFELRRKFWATNTTKKMPDIHVLVLNDRIPLVNQLRGAFFEGRDDKAPLIDSKFQKTITSRTFHSQADDIEDEDIKNSLPEVWTIVVLEQGKGNDTFDFSTFQTATNGLPVQHKPNVIIIDEAHHLSARTYYQTFLQFYKPDESWVYPLVILMTATPDKILHLTGDPLVQFGLPEWIAHKDSPEVNYHLVTNNKITPEDIHQLHTEIVRISQIQDLQEKKKQIKLLKEGEDGTGWINAMLRQYNTNDELVLDLLERVKKLDHTIIFCPSITIVDEVTALINKYTKDTSTALAFHSKIDELDSKILTKYNLWESKVIVAIGKLNEGIDMPQTNNVIFWRETESPTIFQQQFGRGLRGEKVNIYDYVGGIRNMAWINTINQAIDQISATQEDETENDDTDKTDKQNDDTPHTSKRINIVGGGGVWDKNDAISHKVNLSDLLQQLVNEEIDLPTLGADGTVEIDGTIYQRVGAKTPSEQLWWITWQTAYRRINKESPQWKQTYVKHAKTKSWRTVPVVNKEELEKLLQEDSNIPRLGADGTVEIDGTIYQRVGAKTPSEQLWWITWQTAYKKIKNTSPQWKQTYVKQAKTENWYIIRVVNKEELEKLLQEDINIPTLGANGTVEIDGIRYQRVGSNTPSTQLWWVTWQTANKKIKGQQEEWKQIYVKQAKTKDWYIVQVVNKETLKKLLQEDINIPILEEDGTVEIDGTIYQRVGANTPSEQLWWITWQKAYKRINKESPEWKQMYVKHAKTKSWQTVQVVNKEELEKLLQEDINIPILGEDGTVEIDGIRYQRVGSNTPSEQLWWITWQTAYRRINKESPQWKQTYVKHAKTKSWRTVPVVNKEELEKLLQEDSNIPRLGADGTVEIDGTIYQRVGANTPSEQLWWVTWWTAYRRINKESPQWKQIYVKQAQTENWQPVQVVNKEELEKLIWMKK
jgi:superfamily II DNA or RNA helicase